MKYDARGDQKPETFGRSFTEVKARKILYGLEESPKNLDGIFDLFLNANFNKSPIHVNLINRFSKTYDFRVWDSAVSCSKVIEKYSGMENVERLFDDVIFGMCDDKRVLIQRLPEAGSYRLVEDHKKNHLSYTEMEYGHYCGGNVWNHDFGNLDLEKPEVF